MIEPARHRHGRRIATYGQTPALAQSIAVDTTVRSCAAFVAREPIVERRPTSPSASSPQSTTARQRRARRDEHVGVLLQPGHGFTNLKEFVGDDIATEYSASCRRSSPAAITG